MAEEKKETPAETSTETSSSPVPETGSESGEQKKDTVEVDRSVLEQILEKQKDQDETIGKQDEEIKRLTAAADLKRLAKYDAENAGELIRTAKVATLEHKGKTRIVLGWSAVKDYVRFENGVHKYDQVAKYILEGDGEGESIEVEMDQRNWYQEIGRLEGEIIKETSSPDGTSTRVLRFPDGKEIEFDVVFINP